MEETRMNALDLLFEIRDDCDLSTADMATLLGVRDTTVQKWVSSRAPIPENIFSELVQIEEEILRLACLIKAVPALQEFTHAHFKAAINMLDSEDNQ